MKISLLILSASVLFAANASAADVVEQNSSQRTFPMSSAHPSLYVRNVFGNVTVRAGTTREIVVALTERRSAPSRELLEESTRQLQLHTLADSDGVKFVVEDTDRGSRRTELCRHCRVEYEFDITVPTGAQVDVGTVTDGRVEVSGVRGPLAASNVNGPVSVSGAAECSSIESVNGALQVEFARAPGENCAIKTVNGDITIALPANAGLDAMLSMGHGDVQSDFDVEPIAVAPIVDRERRDSGVLYRIDQRAGLRLGAGGPTFTFASLNGDMRFTKKQ